MEAIEEGLCESQQLQVRVTSDNSDDIDVSFSDRGHGTYVVTYTPTTEADHWVAVRYAHTHIPGSPFKVAVAEVEEQIVTALPVVGPNIEFKQPSEAGKIEFTVSQGNASTGYPQVNAIGPNGQKARVSVSEGDGDWLVRVEAATNGRYEVDVLWAGVQSPGCPFIFDIADQVSATQIHVST